MVNLSVFSLLHDPLSCVLHHFHVVDCFFMFEQLDQVEDVGMQMLWVFLQLTMPTFQRVGSSWTVPQMSVAFKPVAGDVKASVEVLLWASSRPSSAWNHTSSSSLTGSSVRTTSLSTNLCMSFLSGIREHCIKSKKKVTSFRIPYLNLSYRKTFFT